MTDNPPETPPQRNVLPPSWLVNLVAVVILVAWIASLVVRMIDPARALPPVVDALMLMVAGFLFAGNLKDRFTGGSNGGNNNGPN
ncbi:membrane protein [Gordonia phage Bunnybear]|uniref:Membrane protein n=1 Tax=Gordonia phage Bunnybear TaxID=2762398 RepID=A0A7G8LLF6_9CAUD|nr:membrane protein [Gordonia phage Bunnybear]QNJ58078.1 membrane protein [Gordonia phage Bunnybear]